MSNSALGNLIPENISFPPELPVSDKAAEIEALIRRHQVVVVAGETGSGKTTQLPKICLKAGLGRKGLIGHTQPRRLAAISVSNRIAEELGVLPGQGVGYQIRFNDQTSDQSFLKLMTDGILLSEIQHDRNLRKYEAIIIDEAHERSLNIDFLLGVLKQLCQRRKDLKVIITSATIDLEKFSKHFDDAPIVSVSGRTYPVETRYKPLEEIAAHFSNHEDPIINGVLYAVSEIIKEDRRNNVGQGKKISGDVLIFLSSEREIRECALALRKANHRDTEVLPLYARLRQSEQARIFSSHRGRRIVLSTNVAETSITVPGIRYVVDSGFARISRYSVQTKVQRLPIEAVSQASAMQRQGRCGRVADGICIRLYSEEDYQSRPLYTDPEIRRTNLASVILQMLSLRLGSIEAFPFLEPPQQRSINDGLKLLLELGAIDSQRNLTITGKAMARFPVDPRYARMLVSASKNSSLNEILIIVSALCIQDPRENPADKRQQAKEALAQFQHSDSDFLSFFLLWQSYEQQRQALTQNRLRKYCKSNFLSFMRMREWREIHHQLVRTCQQLNYRINKREAAYEDVHGAIISGSMNQIALLSEPRIYQSSRNRKFSLFPNSTLYKKSPKWIVSGELLETSRLFSSLAAKIQPEWVVDQALHLVKRSHSDPHWSKKQQRVMAYEKIVLFGLTLQERRQVPFDRIDPKLSRDIFISEALANFQLHTRHGFYGYNRNFLASLRKEEEKLRRPDVFWSEKELVDFYGALVPEQMSGGSRFNDWFSRLAKQQQQAFRLTREAFKQSDNTGSGHFPDKAILQGNSFGIDYRFKPGDQRDGATVTIPIQVLNQLTGADIDWMVPGIQEEKITALLKSLPKSLRKNFIPVSGFVKQVLPKLDANDGTLLEALCAQILRSHNLELHHADFDLKQLSDHLKVKIKVVDAEGKELAFSDELAELQFQLKDEIQSLESSNKSSALDSGSALKQHGQVGVKRTRVQGASQTPSDAAQCDLREADNIRDWIFGDLPESVEIGDQLKLLRFPTLIDAGDSVTLRLNSDKELSKEQSIFGLLRLYKLRSVQQKNAMKKQFTRLEQRLALKLPGVPLNLVDEGIEFTYQRVFDPQSRFPRSSEQFENSLRAGKARLLVEAEAVERLLLTIIDRHFVLRKQIESIHQSELQYLRDDIAAQLNSLLFSGFLQSTSNHWLEQYPRFFKGIEARLAKLPHVGHKDAINTQLLNSYWQRYRKLATDMSERRERQSLKKTQELQKLRFLLEEYRVSLFAQQLKTSVPVSEKRLEKQFDACKFRA